MRMRMRCRNCGSKCDSSKKMRKKGNPSYRVVCPSCGAVNHVKCRHNHKNNGGKPKKVRVENH